MSIISSNSNSFKVGNVKFKKYNDSHKSYISDVIRTVQSVGNVYVGSLQIEGEKGICTIFKPIQTNPKDFLRQFSRDFNLSCDSAIDDATVSNGTVTVDAQYEGKKCVISASPLTSLDNKEFYDAASVALESEDEFNPEEASQYLDKEIETPVANTIVVNCKWYPIYNIHPYDDSDETVDYFNETISDYQSLTNSCEHYSLEFPNATETDKGNLIILKYDDEVVVRAQRFADGIDL